MRSKRGLYTQAYMRPNTQQKRPVHKPARVEHGVHGLDRNQGLEPAVLHARHCVVLPLSYNRQIHELRDLLAEVIGPHQVARWLPVGDGLLDDEDL